MNEELKELPVVTRLLYRVMRIVTRFALPVLVLILAATLFFAYCLKDLKIDANVFSFASNVPPAEFVETPASAPDTPEVVFINPNTEGMEIEHYGYTERPEEEKKAPAVIPESMLKTQDYGYYPDGYVILFSSDLIYTEEVLNLISEIRAQISSLDFVGQCLSPFDYVTVEKVGSRLSVVPIAPVKPGEVWTEEDVELFKERLLSDSVARNFLYAQDGSTIMIYYRTLHLNRERIELLDSIVDPLRDYGRVCLNGGGLITDKVTYYINKDLATLLTLCFIIILVTYYLSFKSKRSVFIPAIMSIMGIIWTLGTMAIMGYKLTIVTLLTPCLVLTLGSSYAIHMISEYFAISRKKDKDRLNIAYAKISKTILSACLTTVIGFLSMLISRTEMFKQFGLTVAIGVAYCAILSLTFLPAILSLQPYPKDKKYTAIEKGLMNRFIVLVVKAVLRYWYVILIVLALITGGFFLVKDKVSFNSNYMAYFPSDDPFVQDSIYFARTMGGTDPYYLTIKAPDGEKNYFLKPENLKKVYDYEMKVMASCPDIVQSLSFSQYVSFLNEKANGESGIPDSAGIINFLYRLLLQMKNQIGSDVLSYIINEDASEITLSMRNYDSYEQDLTTTASSRRIEETLDYYRYMLPEGTSSKIWCSASNALKANDMIMVDQQKSTILALVGIAIVASFTLFSPFRGIISLIPVLVGIMFNYIFMFALSIPFDIVTIGFTSVTIGAGIDDALHFLLRYRLNRKLMKGKRIEDVIETTLTETGRPIILTTLSIDAGLIMLAFASYTPIQYFGLMMCVSLTVAMVSTLFILPVVVLLGVKIKEKMLGLFRR